MGGSPFNSPKSWSDHPTKPSPVYLLSLDDVAFRIAEICKFDSPDSGNFMSNDAADLAPSGSEHGHPCCLDIVHDEGYVRETGRVDCGSPPVTQSVVLKDLERWPMLTVTRQTQVNATDMR